MRFVGFLTTVFLMLATAASAQQIGGTNVPAITYAQPAAAPAAAPTINPSTGMPFSTDPTQAGYYDTTLEPG